MNLFNDIEDNCNPYIRKRNIPKTNMKIPFFTLSLAVSALAQGQGAPDEFIQRFDRAFDYTIALAHAMPESGYDYKPVDSVFTFAEQLNHAVHTIARHTEKYYLEQLSDDINDRYDPDLLDKSTLLSRIEQTRTDVKAVLLSMPTSHWNDKTIAFFSGDFSTGHFFQILLDHMTHHRGMAIIYLRMQGIRPPRYVGW
jgi:uncharacterized damage-inducible protein DinB